MRFHMLAFAVGYVLDMLIGDPYCLPHPIRAIGNMIAGLEKKMNSGDAGRKRRMGRVMWLMVMLVTFVVTAGLLIGAYLLNSYVGVVVEAVMTYQILATKCLKVESMKVYRELKNGDIEGARKAVSMIVGRDTSVLDDIGIAKAAIETVAENTSDGSIAPMLYTALGGPILGFAYKAVNTMDSMVGYKNDRYLDFGRMAAKMDDIFNYIPSRISALLMMVACLFLGSEYSFKDAVRIHKRDSLKHASPNSAQTESTCAGALGIRLAGNAVYFGVLHEKPFIGDNNRPPEYEDIRRANALLYMTAFICAILCLGCMLALG